MDSDVPLQPEPKLSRYRSVRKAQAISPPVQEPPKTADAAIDTVTRSRSRYHGSQHNHTSASPPSRPMQPVRYSATKDSPVPDSRSSQWSQENALRNGAASRTTGRGAYVAKEDATAGANAEEEIAARSVSPRSGEETRRRYDRQHSGRRAEESPELSPSHEDLKKIDALQKGGHEETQKPQRPRPTNQSRSQEQRYRLQVEDNDRDDGSSCFGLFKRKRGEDMPVRAEKTLLPHSSKPAAASKEPTFIKPGGGGIVPGTDAPKSAVNAGDRHVLVECNKSSITMPVAIATTPADLLNSAANCFSDNIDPKTFVLLESFGKVGVRRPLRRYEHVRNVMNSWDFDEQESLIVVPPSAFEIDPSALHVSSVPHKRPAESSFIMYYSQKVGKWDRRHITILEDGQMVSKKSSGDRDAVNVCHLSDFDIYNPTARQMSKKIKPPKKICYAIKSQQKTTIFETTSNFVHFFCTSDTSDGAAFYKAVQGWRSWYLVNKMGEGQKLSRVAQPTTASQTLPARQNSTAHRHQQSKSSMDSHYQLGSFRPLSGMNQFDNRPSTSNSQAAAQLPIRKASVRDRSNHPVPLPRNVPLKDNEPLINLLDRQTSVEEGSRNSDSFAAAGLLGRQYSQRQRTQQEREELSNQPFTNGPSLLSDARRPPTSDGPRRNQSTRQADRTSGHSPINPDIRRTASTRDRNRGSVDLNRTMSNRRSPPKPLIDLTPQYREPPQHVKKGRGFKPDDIGPGGLIDNATTPEQAINVPPATDWRGRNTNNTSTGNRGLNVPSADESRSRSASRELQQGQPRFQNTQAYAALHGGRAAVEPEIATGRLEDDDAFTPGGLLAHAGAGQGGQSTGRGFASGGLANGRPLVDMSEESKFAQGSLLARFEGRS